MKKLTKVLSIVMLVAMCVSMFTIGSFAASCDGTKCGETGTLTKVHAASATCSQDGNYGYFKCVCGKLYSDDGNYRPLTAAEVEIAATGAHTCALEAAVPGTCMVAGTAEHYKCSTCEGLFLDAAGTQPTTLAALATGTGKHVPAATAIPGVAPDCDSTGNYEYYVCIVCGSSCDDAGNPFTATRPATGNHTWGTWIIDEAATAYDSGIRHRVCSGCGDIEYEKIDANGVTVEEADYYLELVGAKYWKSGMDPITFYSEYYDLNVYTGTLKIDGKSIDRESYWANSNGQLILGDKFMSKLSAGKHTAQVVETNSRWIESNTVEFYIAATLKASDTDKHVINSSKSLKFVASDDIVSAKVGSIALTDKDDFKISGNTITLYADFLNDRTAGSTYTLTVTTKGGETASTTFQILTTAQASSSPRTGDDSNIALWSALVLMSGAAMVAVLPRLKKEN